MTVSIIMRAEDPEACANFYEALGARFEPPGRLHPAAWRARVTIDIDIVTGVGSVIEPRLSVQSLMPVVAQAVELGCDADYGRADETPPVVVLSGPCGATVTVEQRSGERFERPVRDTAKAPHVLMLLRPVRAELDALLASLGLSSPRLVGPESLGRGRGGDFVLVVDGGEGGDLRALDSFLGRVLSGLVKATALMSHDLPADRRDFLEAVAFTI